jgi:hypothetical protein
VYATLVFLGACILLFRTIVLFIQGAMVWMMLWVASLLLAEFLLDAAFLLGSVRWWVTQSEEHSSFPLKTAAAAIILHAIRVLIYVLGRVGPWKDFDIKPEHRALPAVDWNLGEVYFAAIMSVLGIIGLLIIWRNRRRSRTGS